MAHPQFDKYVQKMRDAARRVDTEATPAQIDAGVAKLGRVYCHGLCIMIEKPKGSTRSGTGADGKTWSRKMTAHYGYIRNTTGDDGEHVDVFVGEHPQSQLVFLMHQLDKEGNHDEIKVVMATRNVVEAKKTYLSNYPEGWEDERLGEVRGMTMDQFRVWLRKHCPYKVKKKASDSGLLILLQLPSVFGR